MATRPSWTYPSGTEPNALDPVVPALAPANGDGAATNGDGAATNGDVSTANGDVSTANGGVGTINGDAPAHAKVSSDGAADELQRLRRTVAQIAGLTGPAAGPDGPVVAVLDPSRDAATTPEGGALRALGMAAAVTELRRRMAGFDVRAFTLAPDPMVSELGEDMVESLWPWTPDSAARLRQEVDGLVVLASSSPFDGALEEIELAGVPVHRVVVEGERPDTLVLAGRLPQTAGPAAAGLAATSLLSRRREYLSLTGRVPVSDPYVLCLPAETAGDELDARVAPRRVVVRPTEPLVPIDLMALIASAETVVTSSPDVRALAVGLARPVVAGVADLDSTGSPAADPLKQAERLDVLVGLVDRSFDDLYLRLIEDAGTRLASAALDRLTALERRVAALEAVNTGLRHSLARERSVTAAELRRRDSGPAGSSWSTFNVDRMHRDLAAAQAHMARLQGEIDAIYATRTMKALAPVRRLYGVARRFIPRPS